MLRLGDLDETTDPALLAAVALGDVLDDGSPVGCEVLAMALELWSLTGSLHGVASGLEAWRPGEEWAAWTAASWAGWRALRGRVREGLTLVAVVALLDAAEARRVMLEKKAAEVLGAMDRNSADARRLYALLGDAACSTNQG